MSHGVDTEAFPRGALVGAAVLISVTILLAAGTRLGLLSPPQTAADARAEARVMPVVSHDLRILDQADGTVLIRDLGGSADIVIAPGSNNFIRGVMRGLARDRRLRGLDSTPPFTLTRYSDGELTLEDTATGRRIELGGFGPTNRDAFDRLLPGSKAPPEAKVSATRGFGF